MSHEFAILRNVMKSEAELISKTIKREKKYIQGECVAMGNLFAVYLPLSISGFFLHFFGLTRYEFSAAINLKQ